MTKEECSAINSLERAFKKCAKLGIRICGMDSDLHYATKSAHAEGLKITEEAQEIKLSSCGKLWYDEYGATAEAVQNRIEGTGTINTSGVYEDSGGW